MSNKTNMEIYNRLRDVPVEATKPISGGKLKGFTNITPQWRIEALTREFGPCGIGWYFDRPEYSYEKLDSGEVLVFCSINLYVKIGDEWSRPIPGEGGNKLVSKTYNGLESSDEARKMALTDALSTAAKMIGLAADIYYREGKDSKYNSDDENGMPSMFGLPQPPVQQNSTVQDFAPQQNYTPEANPTQRKPSQPQTNNAQPTQPAQPLRYYCTDCGSEITTDVAQFSEAKFGRHLCMNCQKVNKQSATQQVNQQAAYQQTVTPTQTVADPRAMVIPVGKDQGKTIGEVIATDRRGLQYLANQARFAEQFPEFIKALKVVLA